MTVPFIFRYSAKRNCVSTLEADPSGVLTRLCTLYLWLPYLFIIRLHIVESGTGDRSIEYDADVGFMKETYF